MQAGVTAERTSYLAELPERAAERRVRGCPSGVARARAWGCGWGGCGEGCCACWRASQLSSCVRCAARQPAVGTARLGAQRRAGGAGDGGGGSTRGNGQPAAYLGATRRGGGGHGCCGAAGVGRQGQARRCAAPAGRLSPLPAPAFRRVPSSCCRHGGLACRDEAQKAEQVLQEYDASMQPME